MSIHHAHKRKRAIKAAAEVEGMSHEEVQEAVMHPTNRFKRILDRLVYITGAFAVVLSVPQVLQIWVEQNASGVSIITWSAFLCNAIVWSFYSMVHKEIPLMMMYIPYFFIDLFIVIGIITFS